jgi:hypothetical protein
MYSNFVFSPLAVSVQLRRYINIHASSSLRPDWSSPGVQDAGLMEPAALFSRCSASHFDVQCF